MLKEDTILVVDKAFIDKMGKVDNLLNKHSPVTSDDRTRSTDNAMMHDPVIQRDGFFVVRYYKKHHEAGDGGCFYIGTLGMMGSHGNAGYIYLNNKWTNCPYYFLPISGIPERGWVAMNIDISNGIASPTITYTAEEDSYDFSIPLEGASTTIKYPIAKYQYSRIWETYFISLLANKNIPRIDVWGRCDDEDASGSTAQ